MRAWFAVLPVLLVFSSGCIGSVEKEGVTTTILEVTTTTQITTTTAATTTTRLAARQTTTTTVIATTSTSTTLPKAELSYSVSKDAGFRVTGGIPYAYRLNDSKIRLYYCENGINSAISEDGMTFTKEDGARIERGCDPTIVQTEDGKFRMYYKIQSGPGGPGMAVHKIYSAVSNNGLDFREEGLRIDSEKTGDRGWASVPDAIKLPDGRIRIYYVSDDPEAEGGLMSAVSEDGLNFVKEPGARMKGNYVDPSLAVLPDGRYWLLVAHNCVPEKGPCTEKNGLYASTSADGLNYTTPKLVYAAENLFDPAVIEISENKYRIYYGEYGRPGEPSYIKSMVVSVG
jgi:hypothetical protein